MRRAWLVLTRIAASIRAVIRRLISSISATPRTSKLMFTPKLPIRKRIGLAVSGKRLISTRLTNEGHQRAANRLLVM
jgi:hypothetical protein